MTLNCFISPANQNQAIRHIIFPLEQK